MQVLAYWLMRTAVFLAAFGVLYAMRWYDFWALLLALIVGWIVSYIAFPGMRLRAAQQMNGWLARGHRRVDEDADAEDAEAEADTK